MPPFSRLQLAAALIEYDNDPDDPDAPYRSAEASAIFSFLRKRNDPRSTIMTYKDMPRRSVDYLKVDIPGEEAKSDPNANVSNNTAGLEERRPPYGSTSRPPSGEILAGGRKTPDGRRSIEVLARPSSEIARLNAGMFQGADDEYFEDEDDYAEAADLNLASWGVDEFLAKDPKPRARSRASSINALNRSESPGPTAGLQTRSRAVSPAPVKTLDVERAPNRRSAGFRAKSMGEWDISQFDEEIPGRQSTSSNRPRRSSVADPTLIPLEDQHAPTAFRNRANSVSGLSLTGRATPGAENVAPNPFELPLPSPAHTSRFDPKIQAVAHERRMSMGSMHTRRTFLDAQEPEEPVDNTSVMVGAPTESSYRLSRMDMLRPKVLVMPSPLQDQVDPQPLPTKPVRPGYLDSTDSRPLPPGAKTTGADSGVNARSSMTLSQLTFRNSLMVGGQRDPSYGYLETSLKRAQNEGEQVEQERDPEPDPDPDPGLPYRSAGKLYGRSLMDDLEARKAQLKGKQRVFRGDERPSMMQRGQPQRNSTLIDADELQLRAQGGLVRPDLNRNPSSRPTLVNFGDDPIPGTNVQARSLMGRGGAGLVQSRSVFGVDEVWEKELAKLQIIEAQEKAEKEAQRKLEEEKKAVEDAKMAKKTAKKNKGKNKSIENLTALTVTDDSKRLGPTNFEEVSPIARVTTEPPLLPAVKPFPAPAPKEESETESESDDPKARRKSRSSNMIRSTSRQDWLSDDERPKPKPLPRRQPIGADSDSDEDLPLTSALARVKARKDSQQQEVDDDSDEDRPLAAVLNSKSMSTFDFGGTVLAEVVKPESKPIPRVKPLMRSINQDDSDDDDKPLGLQHPNAKPWASGLGGESDDEQPLGMRYSMAPSQMFMQPQQQMMQEQMMQQQMMQQQMMMAAQMQNSMFNPMMMGGMNAGMGGGMPGMNMNMGMGMGMGMPPMGLQNMSMGMMSMPQLAAGEPTIDPAKYGAVDRWRKNVGSADDG